MISFQINTYEVSAAGIISNDTTNKVLTITVSNLTMQIDYNNKCKITSMKMGSGQVEALDSIGATSGIEIPSSTYYSTGTLTTSPSVTISANAAIISNIQYGSNDIKVTETWTVTANDDDIQLRLDKTYDWLTGAYTTLYQKSLGYAFVTDRFDNVYVENGAGYVLQDELNRSKQRIYGNGDYYATYGNNGMNQRGRFNRGLWVDLIDNPDDLILSMTASTTLKGATEVYRNMNGSYALKVDHILSPNTINLYTSPFNCLDYMIDYDNSSGQHHGYAQTTVADLQTDTVTYTYKVTPNRNKYYVDPLTLPTTSRVNATRFLRCLQDIGRYDESDYGASDTMSAGLGSWLAAWTETLFKALQIGDGNTGLIDGNKRAIDQMINGGGQDLTTGKCVGGWGSAPYYPDAYENQAAFVHLISQTFDVSGDTAWLTSVANNARLALDYDIGTDSDNDGLREGKFDNHEENTGAVTWNDCIDSSHEDAYSNAILYGALRRWADIEQNVLGNFTNANKYNDFADKLKTSYNKDVSEGGLWSTTHNAFVYWRDKDNSIHGDVKHMQVNAMASYFGIADKNRVKTIFLEPFDGYSSVEDFLEKNNCNGVPTNLFSFDPLETSKDMKFGSFENGGTFAQNTLELERAYGALGISNDIGKYVKNSVDFSLDKMDLWWDKDTPNWDYSSMNGTWVCNYQMVSNVWPAAGFIVHTLGINPRYNCLEVKPALNTDEFNGTVINYTLRGKKYTITINNLNQRTIILPSGAEQVRMIWQNLDEDSNYTIRDEKSGGSTNNYSISSNEDGVLIYNLSDSTGGTHTITIGKNGDFENPGQVMGLNVSSSGLNANLSWTAASDNIAVSMYNIHRGTISGFTPDYSNKIGEASGTSYTDDRTGLAGNTTYYYKVIAQDSAGNTGTPSSSSSVTFLGRAGANASSINTNGWGAGRIYDNDINTCWSSIYHGQFSAIEWVAVDIGTIKLVDRLQVVPRGGGYCFPVDFNLQYSLEGTNWYDIPGQSYTDYPNPGSAAQTFTFNAVPARFIRMYATKLSPDNFGDAYMQIAEMYVETLSFSLLPKSGVNASSYISGLEAEKTIDNNNDTCWSSTGYGSNPIAAEWICVDTGAINPIGMVHVVPRFAAYGFPVDFKFQYSTDGINWTDVPGQSYTNFPKPGPSGELSRYYIQTFTFGSPVSARYIRMYATKLGPDNSGDHYFQLGEVYVYRLGAVLPKTNVNASTYISGMEATKAIDNNNETCWSSTGHGSNPMETEWISVDTGTINSIGEIEVVPRVAGYGFPVDFKFQFSTDGISWTDVPGQSYINYPNPGSTIQRFTFGSNISARYIRIHATKLGPDNFGDYYFQLAEISVYKIGDTLTKNGANVSTYLGGWDVSQAIDDKDTCWSSEGHGGNPIATEWIYLDTGEINSIDRVNVVPRAVGYCFPVDFKFQSSTDGINWTDVPGQSYTNYPNPGSSATQTFAFGSPLSARYIRMYATKLGPDNSGNHYFQIAEVYVD